MPKGEPPALTAQLQERKSERNSALGGQGGHVAVADDANSPVKSFKTGLEIAVILTVRFRRFRKRQRIAAVHAFFSQRFNQERSLSSGNLFYAKRAAPDDEGRSRVSIRDNVTNAAEAVSNLPAIRNGGGH